MERCEEKYGTSCPLSIVNDYRTDRKLVAGSLMPGQENFRLGDCVVESSYTVCIEWNGIKRARPLLESFLDENFDSRRWNG